MQAHFLPTPYNPRALAGLFISKVFVTSLEKLFIGLKELTSRKSSHVTELGALLNYFFSYNFFPHGYLLSFVIDYEKSMHWQWSSLDMFLEGIQGSVRKRFCALYSETRKAADMREEGNKYTARVIYLQDSCQLQDIVLPILFKWFDARKSAKQRKGEIWGNVANISTETWFRVRFQKVYNKLSYLVVCV